MDKKFYNSKESEKRRKSGLQNGKKNGIMGDGGKNVKLSLCIPLYNEEKILRDTCRTVRTYLDERFGGDYEA